MTGTIEGVTYYCPDGTYEIIKDRQCLVVTIKNKYNLSTEAIYN